jgi:hypothetical protein
MIKPASRKKQDLFLFNDGEEKNLYTPVQQRELEKG